MGTQSNNPLLPLKCLDHASTLFLALVFITSYIQVLSSKGNNLHEVETSDGKIFLASMPTKFRKNVWIKRGKAKMHYRH